MLHTLGEFCRFMYPSLEEDAQRRCYYQLVRLSKNSYLRGCYRPLLLSKRGGGSRQVLAPSAPLKFVQRGILALLSDVSLSNHAMAYRPGRSVLQNALPHCGQRLVVQLDIKNFFGSIGFVQVFRAIDRALADSAYVGRHYLNGFDRCFDDKRHYNQVLSFYFTRFCTLDGVLPQGAPTSPLLSNLVFAPIDRVISRYCARHGLCYTRYSDDLTFSGPCKPKTLISFVGDVLKKSGFLLNESKTAIRGPGDCKRITGVVVNKAPGPGRDYYRRIRQELYYIRRYGMESHLCHLLHVDTLPAGAAERYRQSLAGRIAHLRHLRGSLPPDLALWENPGAAGCLF